MSARDALRISTRAESGEEDPDRLGEPSQRKCFCRQRLPCCCWCGPSVPRWLWCSMCLIICYAVLTPLMFLAIHFCVYPGNLQGDMQIPGQKPIQFAASYDGQWIQGVKVPITNEVSAMRAPLIFFGGNAQGMTGSALDARWVFGEMARHRPDLAWDVYAVAYRGYAPNSGWITQKAVTSDAEDLLQFVLNRTQPSGGRVFLGGWSMGAGVAAQLAAKRPADIAGVILYSPWSTLHEEALGIVAPLTYLIWPWIWTLDVWDSVSAMSSLPTDMPVAVVSASSDQVIRPWHHRKIYEAVCPGGATCKDKWWVPTVGATHADLIKETRENWRELLKWTQAAWKRVQVFDDHRENRSAAFSHNTNATGDDLSHARKAFDPVGDAVSRVETAIHKMFTPLDV